jgi:hypothetical protein
MQPENATVINAARECTQKMQQSQMQPENTTRKCTQKVQPSENAARKYSQKMQRSQTQPGYTARKCTQKMHSENAARKYSQEMHSENAAVRKCSQKLQPEIALRKCSGQESLRLELVEPMARSAQHLVLSRKLHWSKYSTNRCARFSHPERTPILCHSFSNCTCYVLYGGVPVGPRAGFATRFWVSASGLVSWGGAARGLHTQPMLRTCELSSTQLVDTRAP